MTFPLTEESIYIAEKYSIEKLARCYEATRNGIIWHATIANAVRIQCGVLCS